MLNAPFNSVREDIVGVYLLDTILLFLPQSFQAKGMASKCVVSDELERLSGVDDPAEERVIKNVAATMYAAGADTVVSAISTFFLAMALYPDVQKRGQKEIDQHIGHGQRLPLFTDRAQLPFIVSTLTHDIPVSFNSIQDYICYEVFPAVILVEYTP
jgi:hypothetical protein